MAERDIIARIVVEGGQQAATQLDNVAKSEREIVAATKEANVALNTQNQELSENTAQTKGAVNAQQSLKKQLRDLKAELARLAVAGKTNTEEYRRLREEAGQLADAIGDVNAEIAQAGSDTRGLDQVIRVTSVAAAGFGIVEGAAALFGNENEELQKSLLKVNAAMTVLTSLQQIQEELLRKDSLFTTAAAKAKALYAAAVGGSTGALKLFRLALIATGIGAAVVAIGLLVANWDMLSRAITKSFPRLADFGAQVQRIIQIVTDFLGLTSAEGREREKTVKALEAENRELERQADLLSAQGENVKAAEKRLQIAEKQVQILKAQKAASEDVKDAENDVKIAEQEVTNAKNDAAKAAEKKTKATKDETDAIKAQSGSLAALNKELQRLQELQQASGNITEIAKYQTQIDTLKQRIDLLNRAIEQFVSFQNRVSENATTNFQPIITAVQRVKTDAELAAEAYERLPQVIKDANEELARNPPRSPFEGVKSPQELRKERQAEVEGRLRDAQTVAAGSFAVFQQLQAAQQQVLENRLRQGIISEQEYQQELAKLRRKEAVQAKLQAVFAATINLAQAITTALAKTGNPVIAGIVAALAAAQLAAIVATPIPKFRYGGQVLEGGKLSPEGMLSGRSHAGGGVLIEAEGGEFITRREMAKKYLPVLKAINQDKFGEVMYPKIPIMRTFGSVATQSQRKADKRMQMLIEEVQFMSQYIRQGNKYARVTAETNKQIATTSKGGKHYV